MTRPATRPRPTGKARVPVSSGTVPTWRRPPVLAAVAAVLAVVGLFGIYTAQSSGGSTSGPGSASGIPFEVGEPSSGPAPSLQLPVAGGGEVDLSTYAGRSVLLYFQEGLMCQACWTQLADLEAARADLTALGVDELVTVTTDPVDLLTRKVRDDGYTTPVASDEDGSVSATWGTLGRGMMGGDMNGHSFVLVGPDGQIQWRADYGGAPDYTMYVPVQQLLADLRQGTGQA